MASLPLPRYLVALAAAGPAAFSNFSRLFSCITTPASRPTPIRSSSDPNHFVHLLVMSSRSPLESKVGELRVVSRPQHIEVDTGENHPSHFSVGVWLDTSSFTRSVRAAWGTLGGFCQIQAFELRVRCAGVSRHEFIGRECRTTTPGSIVNFQGKVIREDEHICANFTVDIPPSLHPPHGGESTYELVASVTIVTTDAMGAKGVIVRTGVAEIDITSKHSPVFINPLTPSGPGPWSYTRC